MKLLALLDPYPGYDFRRDTSHLLLWEAERCGWEVFYGTLPQIAFDRTVCAGCTSVKVLPSAPFFEFVQTSCQPLADFSAILIRKDPPVDESYLQATRLLSLTSTLVLNPPRLLQTLNEKLSILHFPEWIPKTMVTADLEQAKIFQDSLGGPLVVKPLNGFAGKGVIKIASSEELIHVFRTRNERNPVMLQEYLPAIHQGEKRLFFCEDRQLPPLLKIPAPGQFLANPDLGATLAPTELTPREKILAEELGRFFRQNGIFLAGVDLIGERLTEINITSPGMLWELNEVYDAHFEKDIVDLLLSLVSSRLRLECR